MSSFGSTTFQTLPKGTVINCELGCYEVQSFVARGRVCAIHVGKNEPMKSSAPMYVAIKFFSGHQEYRGALQRELMVLEAMAGEKYIVQQLCGVSKARSGDDVLLLELLTGTMVAVLPSTILDHNCPSPWLLHTFALHTMRGLKSLHRAGFVHGDIKLQNVMWCSERSAFVLIDFGLSTRVNERYCFQVQSKGCSAPEVVRWNTRVLQSPSIAELKEEAVERPGQPADVWALGCTLAKAALGISLFSNGGPEEQTAVDDVLEARFSKIASRYSSEFCDALLNFIKLCLRVAPAERATAAQLCLMPWRGVGDPSHADMVTLPCPQLKIQNVCDPGSETADVRQLVSDCRIRYGRITKFRVCPEEGALYLLFRDCLDAELACQMMHRQKWRGRNILPVFFPIQNYLEDD